MKVRPGAVVRGVGVAAACLTSDVASRSPVLLAGYTGGWLLDKPGLQVFMVVPDTEEPWKRASVSFLTSVASWSTVMLAATSAVRATRLPAPVAAILLAGGVVVADSAFADLNEARAAAAAVDPDGDTQTAG